MRVHILALALIGLAACTAQRAGHPVPLADVPDDPLAVAAAMLVAAEAAPDAAARAPFVARLDVLGVSSLADVGVDDPLVQWRREYSPVAGDEVYRGRTLGPAYRRAQIAAGGHLVFEQLFNAGERAEMVAQAGAGHNVDVAVANAQSQKICEARLSPAARCRWLPIFTERFKITLSNRGGRAVSVYLVFD